MAGIGEIRDPRRDAALLALLEANGLTLPEGADDGAGLYDDDGRLIGCGFLKGGMIQGVALAPDRQGEGLAATLIGALIQRAVARGLTSYQVITRPDTAGRFTGLGFRRVADASPHAVLLEGGARRAEAHAERLRALARGRPAPRACLVMNGSPFTLGHRALIERAAAEDAWAWVLVVEEDLSAFPFADRLRLMRMGTRDLPNVEVVPGGELVISAKTFPAYFTKDAELATAQGAMDAAVFCELVAPALGVTRRYVGTEPLDPATARYNEVLLDRLPRDGIEVVVMERASAGGAPISASRARQCLEEGDWETLASMVPAHTLDYLRDVAARRTSAP